MTTTVLNIIAFPGAPNLPLFAAEAQGFLEDAGLAITFETTPSSVSQFERFAAGVFDIAFTAFDNVVAYRSGQGAAASANGLNVRAVLGATQLELSLVTAPDVETVADLAGRSIALDAPSTGFAFVVYDMLARGGLAPGSYEVAAVGSTPDRWNAVREGVHAATVAIEPFTSIARGAGFPTLVRSTDIYESYQGGVVAARGDWAAAERQRLAAFLGAYRRGLAWTLDPANSDTAAALLASRMPEIRPQALPAVMKSLLDPRSGLTPDGAFLPAGAQQVLDLRARYGSGGALGGVESYLDRSFA